jgi:transposase
MRKLKEVLRLHSLGLKQQQIARSCLIAQSTVHLYLKAAAAAGVKWPLPPDWDDRRLEEAVSGAPRAMQIWRKSEKPDFGAIRHELQRHRNLTLQLVWEEYRQDHPDGYSYSRFCELYRDWGKNLDVVLRHEYRAGEKLFIDYAGDKIPIYDRQTGEVDFQASLFVAVLGASSYTFVEATRSQDLSCWIDSHVHALEFLGGAPEVAIPDNTKTGVKHPCRYEPELNPTYRELAEHYGFAVVPARPYKPRDKAKVEAGVQVAQRWIVAVLRHRKFFHLADLNEAIAELLDRLNGRPFRKRPDVSRTLLYEQLDRPALKPLPAERYVLAHWKPVRPNIELSRRNRTALLQRAIPTGGATIRRALHGDDGGDLPSRHTGRLPYPQLRCLRRHHHPRTSTQKSSGTFGMDTLAFDQLGGNRRSRYR